MSRYIDADALKEQVDAIWDNRAISLLGCRILTMIDNAPSIDIVRCGECKYYEDPDHKIFENCVKWKESHGILLPMKPNDSCSYGEREGE